MTRPAPAAPTLGPLTKRISQRQVDMFTPVRPDSIHTDEAAATRHGYRAPLAQGLMSVGYIAEMMTAAFGVDFLVGGRVTVSFIEPVHVGDELTVTGTVRTDDDPDVGTTYDVRCVNQLGELATVGTASARRSTHLEGAS